VIFLFLCCKAVKGRLFIGLGFTLFFKSEEKGLFLLMEVEGIMLLKFGSLCGSRLLCGRMSAVCILAFGLRCALIAFIFL
jgi:hypothetical protein